MPMERLSFLPLLNTLRLPVIPPKGEEVHGNTLGCYTIVASAIYCKVSNAFLKASPSIPADIPHSQTLTTLAVVSAAEEHKAHLLVNFQLSHRSALLSWCSPTSTDRILMSALILWRALQHQARCSGRTALSWNEAQSKAVFTDTMLGVQNPEGELGSTAPAPAVTCPKVTCRATSIRVFLLANGSWVPGCCCIVCSRHTVTPQGTLLRTNIRKTLQNHKLIISPAGGEEAWL